MKIRIILMVGAVVSYLAAAQAAELPIYKAPVRPILPVWTGAFFGAHVGVGSSQKKFVDNFPVFDGELDAAPFGKGALAGFQFGYNYQINWLVLGIETDFSWAAINSKGFSCFSFGNQLCSAENQWFATVAGRAGVAFGQALVFAKGGIAWVRDAYSNVATCSGAQPTVRAGISAACGDLFTAQETRFGWIIGGGVEYAIAQNWSVKLEYNHILFGKKSISFTDSNNGLFTEEIHQSSDLVKLGLNYRFNPGRTIAKPILSVNNGFSNKDKADDEKPNKIVYFASVDAARQSTLGWAGALFAPYNDLDTSGLRLMLLGGGGRYKYFADGTAIRGTHSFGDVLAGYGLEGDNYSINLLAGLSAANHILSPFDPTNMVQGTELGVKVRSDAQVNPTPRSLVYGEAEYSTAFSSFLAKAKVGYDFFRTGVFVGPEVSYSSDRHSSDRRIGAHISQITLGVIQADISAGYSIDSVIGRGAYGRMELSHTY